MELARKIGMAQDAEKMRPIDLRQLFRGEAGLEAGEIAEGVSRRHFLPVPGIAEVDDAGVNQGGEQRGGDGGEALREFFPFRTAVKE